MILRTYLLFAVIIIALGSCADKMICPAYQSSFIYDKEVLRKKFSYFENDSVPKVLTASKTKYLIAVPESYRKRYRKMQTVEMKPIYTVLEDSAEGKGFTVLDDSIYDKHLYGPRDTTAVKVDSTKNEVKDTVYVISKDKEVRILKYNFPDSLKYDSITGLYVREKPPRYYVDEVGYNTEQENYMWYFRKELILPDVRLSKVKEKESKEKKTEVVKKKSFFQKLMFWKRDKKSKTDTLKVAPVDSLAVDDFDYGFNQDSTTSATQVTPEAKPKRKGIFSIFKRKKKPAADAEKEPDPNKPPAKKEEDGF
jgi:hypothetical protein